MGDRHGRRGVPGDVGADLRKRRDRERSGAVEVDGCGSEHSVEHVFRLELEREHRLDEHRVERHRLERHRVEQHRLHGHRIERQRDDEQRIDGFRLGVLELEPIELVLAELGDDEPVVIGALRR
jgi:hypothetical protein